MPPPMMTVCARYRTSAARWGFQARRQAAYRRTGGRGSVAHSIHGVRARLGFLGCSTLSAVYALTGLLGILATDFRDPIETEGMGVVIIAIACAGWLAASLGLASLGVLSPTDGVRFTLRAFAYGWFFGVAVDLAFVLIRAYPPRSSGFATALLEAFSFAVVALILCIPALLALMIAKR